VWEARPQLPKPRSTHDAVVMGDKIYVIGGWSMQGGGSENAEFLEDALVFDLGCNNGQWEKLPAPPFRRRALAVAAISGHIYALGGLNDQGKVVKSVETYDPRTKVWSKGPDLPVGERQGFGSSAFAVENQLYISGIDGLVYRLNKSGAHWDPVGILTLPRLTHRLLPGIARDLLVVGGSNSDKPTPLIESIALDR
jgi:N-acetylneuraminic acid mutarotase